MNGGQLTGALSDHGQLTGALSERGKMTVHLEIQLFGDVTKSFEPMGILLPSALRKSKTKSHPSTSLRNPLISYHHGTIV